MLWRSNYKTSEVSQTSEVFITAARLTKELEAQFEKSDKLEKVIRNNLGKLNHGN